MAPIMADHVEACLKEAHHHRRMSANTVRSYRYESQAAANHFTGSLDQISLDALEIWTSHDGTVPSTVGRRTASLGRFYS